MTDASLSSAKEEYQNYSAKTRIQDCHINMLQPMVNVGGVLFALPLDLMLQLNQHRRHQRRHHHRFPPMHQKMSIENQMGFWAHQEPVALVFALAGSSM